jgi:tRNA (5-methylaminomethyl-2-thiouridylate)-methyltransferase
MKIAVLVSGGVDSAVALMRLHQEGVHELTAFYLKIWLEDELSFLGTCPWQEDLSYVQDICASINVPLRIVSLQKEYHDAVVSYMLAQIHEGRTPNPDIMCNSLIKFGAFFDYIETEKFDKIASGHYAQIQQDGSYFKLMRAVDPIKDQTYFLSRLSDRQLSIVMFPIGHLNKSQVREYARMYNLPNKDRRDSQGICFLGKIKFRDFIKTHLGIKNGQFIEYETGKNCGQHEGYWFYTIGQRQGIGLSGGPWYVVAKDHHKNQVFISRNYYDTDKVRSSFFVKSPRWIAGFMPSCQMNISVKMRHGQAEYEATIVSEKKSDVIRVNLASSDQGIAPGQFVVFYDGLLCVGSGMIEIDVSENL